MNDLRNARGEVKFGEILKRAPVALFTRRVQYGIINGENHRLRHYLSFISNVPAESRC